MSEVLAKVCELIPIETEPDMGYGKTGVQFARLLIESPGQFHRLGSNLGLLIFGFEISIVGRELRGIALRRRLTGELDSQCLRDRGRDLILHGKNVAQFPVKTLRPEVRSVRCIDQLSSDANPVSRAADAAFEDSADAECFGNAANVLLFAAESKRRGSCDDFESGNL